MQANEFIKKFGLLRAKQILKYVDNHHVSFLADGFSTTYLDHESCDLILLSDLKRLVESHEIVESHGGLDGITKWIESDGLSALNADFNRAIQARADVESC